MGKIPKTSERYRTKEQMVGDLVIALNSDMTYAGKYSVLKDANGGLRRLRSSSTVIPRPNYFGMNMLFRNQS